MSYASPMFLITMVKGASTHGVLDFLLSPCAFLCSCSLKFWLSFPWTFTNPSLPLFPLRVSNLIGVFGQIFCRILSATVGILFSFLLIYFPVNVFVWIWIALLDIWMLLVNCYTLHLCIYGAHSARVKGIVALTRNDGADIDDPHLLASASSDGIIRVWDVRMAMKEKPIPLAEVNTKSRLTSLAGTSLKSLKRPQMGSTAALEE